MTALADQARDDAEMQKILHDAAIGHRTAARLINELRGQSITSEKSVRRYRRNRHQETPPKPQPRTPASGWTPGIDYDPAEGGEFRTVPRQVDKDAPEAEPDEDALLREWDLDPAVWEVVSARKSLWQGGAGGTWLEARRVSFRKRGPVAGLDTPADIEGILAGYPALEQQPAGDGILLAVVADCQAGKPDAGGSEQLVRAYKNCVDGVAQRIREMPGGRAKLLVFADVGDPVEGYVSQGGKNVILDLSLTEQIRVMRRLWLHAIGVLAPLCDRMLCPAVPDNHGQTTRQWNTKPSDNFALEIASSVADALAMSNDYRHVEFVFPEEDEISLAVNVGDNSTPLVVGFTHGHMVSQPSGIPDWWARQTAGNQPVASARILITGHHHHLRIQATGGEKYWIMCPALEGGSDWYRHRRGDNSVSGILSVALHPAERVPWRNIQIHTS